MIWLIASLYNVFDVLFSIYFSLLAGMLQKPAIRVKTIVSPVGSPRPRKGGVSPHRSLRDSHSPVSISITDETSMDTAS